MHYVLWYSLKALSAPHYIASTSLDMWMSPLAVILSLSSFACVWYTPEFALHLTFVTSNESSSFSHRSWNFICYDQYVGCEAYNFRDYFIMWEKIRHCDIAFVFFIGAVWKVNFFRAVFSRLYQRINGTQMYLTFLSNFRKTKWGRIFRMCIYKHFTCLLECLVWCGGISDIFSYLQTLLYNLLH